MGHPLEFMVWAFPLADASRRFDEMGRRFRSVGDGLGADQLLMLLAAGTAVIAAGSLAWLVVRWSRARRECAYHCQRRLFLELTRAHHLSAADQQLLRAIAAWHRLRHPALLFVEPLRFYTPTMIVALGNQDRIAQLAQRLFGND